MIEKFLEINKLISKSQEINEREVNSTFIKQAKEKMELLKDYLFKNFNIDKDFFQSSVSVGKGNVASSPWIGFLVKEHAKTPEGIYVTFIFLPKTNELFLTIQGKSKNYKKNVETLRGVFDFYKVKYKKIEQQYNFLWRNSNIPNEKLIEEENYNSTTNSYLFTSIFYELINLNKITSKELDLKIQQIFNIFLSVEDFYKNPKKMKTELDEYLDSRILENNSVLINDEELEEIIDSENFDYQKKLEVILKEKFSKIRESKQLVNSDFNENILQNLEKESSSFPKKNLKKKKKMNSDVIKKIQEYNKELGTLGEIAVLNYEKEYLKEHDRTDLAKLVKHVALENETEGYDILSYDLNGNKKYIEVKTSKSKINKNMRFFISHNERRFFENHDNAFIYIIGNFEDSYPEVFKIDKSFREKISYTATNYIAKIN